MAKVLVVDPAPNSRDWLTQTLGSSGHDVTEEKNGRIALENAGQGQTDLILLEVQMPGMDGFEVLKKLKENADTESIPVVMMGSSTSATSESISYKLGAVNYLTKPCPAGTVKSVVNSAIREASAAPKSVRSNGAATSTQVSASQMASPGTPRPQNLIRGDDNLISLDRTLGGGLPVGSLTLLEGDKATGKSVLGQHYAHGAHRDGLGVAYYSSEHTAESLVNQMESIGLNVSKHLQRNEFSINPIEKTSQGEDPERSLDKLADNIESIPSQYGFIIVDDITDLAIHSTDTAIIRFFSYIKNFSSQGRTSIVLSRSYALEERLLRRLQSLCNAHLKLGDQLVGAKPVKMLSMLKMRNVQSSRPPVIGFEVQSETGIKFLPVQQLRI